MHPTPHDIEKMDRAALLPLWVRVDAITTAKTTEYAVPAPIPRF